MSDYTEEKTEFESRDEAVAYLIWRMIEGGTDLVKREPRGPELPVLNEALEELGFEPATAKERDAVTRKLRAVIEGEDNPADDEGAAEDAAPEPTLPEAGGAAVFPRMLYALGKAPKVAQDAAEAKRLAEQGYRPFDTFSTAEQRQLHPMHNG